MKRTILCGLLFTLLLLSRTYAAQFIPLSDLVPGMQVSEVRDVSNDSTTVVGAYFNGTVSRAFHWRLGIGLVEMLRPNLEPINGLSVAVSADGHKVLGTDAEFGPFLWTEGGGSTFLNLFPGESFSVSDLSADGTVVVGNVKRETPQGVYEEPFLWSETSGITVIDPIAAANGGRPYAHAVSDDGSTVVGVHAYYSTGQPPIGLAFRWTEAGGTESLGTPIGSDHSTGIEASADGAAILGQSLPNSNHFIWRESSGFQMLGPHPDAAENGTAYSAQDMTSDGKLVVGFAHVAGNREPFVWDESRGFRNLRTILDSATFTPLAGWDDLGVADAISENGTVIIGYGTPNSSNPPVREQGWVMLFEPGEIVPEPSSLLLATLSLGSLLWHRCKSGLRVIPASVGY